MNTESAVLQVGLPFPYPLVDDAAWWDIENNLLVFSTAGLSDASYDDLTVEQVWLAALGPAVGLLVGTRSFAVEAVGLRAPEAPLPGWVTSGNFGHLMVTVVWVDDIGKIVVRMHAFTLPPDVTRILIDRARAAWLAPLSSNAAAMKVQGDWQDRFPTLEVFKDRSLATCRPGEQG